MKKLFAFVLVVVLMFSLSAVALAASNGSVNSDGGTSQGDVDVKFSSDKIGGGTPGDADEPTFNVSIAWDTLVFTYNLGNYNASTTQYEDGTGWDATSKNITVTNKSNTPITVTSKFNSTSNTTVTNNGVTATVAESVDIATGAGTGTGATGTLAVNVSGTPTNTSENFTVDQITLTIADKATD